MIIGFTGTQKGMTPKQKWEVAFLLEKFRREDGFVVLHHGDCIGADAEAHNIAMIVGASIIIHPPDKSAKRAFCKERALVSIEKAKPYLDRNRDIVKACDVLVAAPKSRSEEVRSGTWFTIRYARLMEKPIHLIFP